MTRASSYLSLGENMEEKGKYFKAERLYKKALKIREAEVESLSPELVPYLYSLGMAQAVLDRTSAALRTFDRLLSILIREHGEAHEDVKEIHSVIDELHMESAESSVAVNA